MKPRQFVALLITIYAVAAMAMCVVFGVIIARAERTNAPNKIILIMGTEVLADPNYGLVHVLYYTIDGVPFEQFFRTVAALEWYKEKLATLGTVETMTQPGPEEELK